MTFILSCGEDFCREEATVSAAGQGEEMPLTAAAPLLPRQFAGIERPTGHNSIKISVVRVAISWSNRELLLTNA